MITALTMIIVIWSTGVVWIWIIAFNLWMIVALSRNLYIDRHLNKKFGEIEGAFRVLRLLGLIDDDKPSGKKDRETKKQKRALFERLKETWGKIRLAPQLQPQLAKIKS